MGGARAAGGWEGAGWVMGAVRKAGWGAEVRVVGAGTGVKAAQDWGVMGAVATAEREAVGLAVKEAMGWAAGEGAAMGASDCTSKE